MVLYEGVVFEHRRYIETLRRAGVIFDQALLSGGGSRSVVWAKMFADILNVSVSQMTATVRYYQLSTELANYYSERYEIFLQLSDQIFASWEKLKA